MDGCAGGPAKGGYLCVAGGQGVAQRRTPPPADHPPFSQLARSLGRDKRAVGACDSDSLADSDSLTDSDSLAVTVTARRL